MDKSDSYSSFSHLYEDSQRQRREQEENEEQKHQERMSSNYFYLITHFGISNTRFENFRY